MESEKPKSSGMSDTMDEDDVELFLRDLFDEKDKNVVSDEVESLLFAPSPDVESSVVTDEMETLSYVPAPVVESIVTADDVESLLSVTVPFPDVERNVETIELEQETFAASNHTTEDDIEWFQRASLTEFEKNVASALLKREQCGRDVLERLFSQYQEDQLDTFTGICERQRIPAKMTEKTRKKLARDMEWHIYDTLEERSQNAIEDLISTSLSEFKVYVSTVLVRSEKSGHELFQTLCDECKKEHLSMFEADCMKHQISDSEMTRAKNKLSTSMEGHITDTAADLCQKILQKLETRKTNIMQKYQEKRTTIKRFRSRDHKKIADLLMTEEREQCDLEIPPDLVQSHLDQCDELLQLESLNKSNGSNSGNDSWSVKDVANFTLKAGEVVVDLLNIFLE